ncbi:MAG TPA: malto-oligosyltrehalose synthase [Candidatus Binatia bacterium]|nr:malto-oligosyltrehalose synthase [Candidatus Binatia bacterium]
MRIPRATYRIQFTPAFGFAAAREIVPYLHRLGVTDIYASPIFHARQGSSHGYDVVDPTRLNPELGSEAEFDALIEAVRRRDMGWIQDIVPNHMAYDGQNRMLMDVLENGPASPYFDFFDIDWNHPYESIRGRVLAPFLGGFYGTCLENGEIALRYDQDGLSIHYYNLRLPVVIESYAAVFAHGLGALRRKLGGKHPDYVKLLGVLFVLKNLPPKEDTRERVDQVIFVKSMLWELCGNPQIKQWIDTNVARFNGVKGDPQSFDLLDRLLSEQLFRLSFWKVAAEELDYRRFFNINELISLRVEDERVFRHGHELIFKLARDGKITGLRIDHIDGLYDPFQYLERLRKEVGDLYIVVEKILDQQENLPADWPVQGNTGYDFLNHVAGLFCDAAKEKKLSQIYRRFSGVELSCREIAIEKKRLIIGKYMAGDIESLAHLLKSILSRDRHSADVTLYGLKRALVELLTFFPVYRSYVNDQRFTDADRRLLGQGIERSRQANPGLLLEIDFIARFLLLDYPEHLADEERRRWRHFVMRFQQFTGPLMAKGFEDTTLYVYNRLLSLNNVGGDPGQFGTSAEEFHRFNERRQARWPHSMNATSTHDTKRGEDSAARISVLSELAEEWKKGLASWSKLNRGQKTWLDRREAPDRNDEYALYQTLIGVFPFGGEVDGEFVERIQAYSIKAVREAKVHTEWLKPDLAYEEAFVRFIEAILTPSKSNRFLVEFSAFAEKIARYGALNSLTQILFKIASPGVPDFYQGSELWDLSLVDPDNRRPVDWGARQKALDSLAEPVACDPPAGAAKLLYDLRDGRTKLFLIQRALCARNKHPELFQSGAYLPLAVHGRFKDHLIAFARRHENHWAVAIAPRLITRLGSAEQFPLGDGVWQDTAVVLPEGAPKSWRDQITDATMESEGHLCAGAALAHFPVALLLSTASPT